MIAPLILAVTLTILACGWLAEAALHIPAHRGWVQLWWGVLAGAGAILMWCVVKMAKKQNQKALS